MHHTHIVRCQLHQSKLFGKEILFVLELTVNKYCQIAYYVYNHLYTYYNIYSHIHSYTKAQNGKSNCRTKSRCKGPGGGGG